MAGDGYVPKARLGIMAIWGAGANNSWATGRLGDRSNSGAAATGSGRSIGRVRVGKRKRSKKARKQESKRSGGEQKYIEKSGNIPSYSLVWVNVPSGVNMPLNVRSLG